MKIQEALRKIGVARVLDGTTAFSVSCPFHAGGTERDPSCRVYPDTDSIYCFTCAKSWDTIGVLMEGIKIGFPEAAKMAGRQIVRSATPQRQAVSMLLDWLLLLGTAQRAGEPGVTKRLKLRDQMVAMVGRGDGDKELIASLANAIHEIRHSLRD